MRIKDFKFNVMQKEMHDAYGVIEKRVDEIWALIVKKREEVLDVAIDKMVQEKDYMPFFKLTCSNIALFVSLTDDIDFNNERELLLSFCWICELNVQLREVLSSEQMGELDRLSNEEVERQERGE